MVPIYCRHMEAWLEPLLNALSLPEVGLSTLFVVALLSATLLPMGSEPALFGLVKLNPDLLWPAVVVATVGNTLGGAISWGMGYGAHRAWDNTHPQHRAEGWALHWLRHFGPKACLLSWLPVVGDPLCAVAGWLRLAFWPCVAYMAMGKALRYVAMTSGLLWLFPGAG